MAVSCRRPRLSSKPCWPVAWLKACRPPWRWMRIHLSCWRCYALFTWENWMQQDNNFQERRNVGIGNLEELGITTYGVGFFSWFWKAEEGGKHVVCWEYWSTAVSIRPSLTLLSAVPFVESPCFFPIYPRTPDPFVAGRRARVGTQVRGIRLDSSSLWSHGGTADHWHGGPLRSCAALVGRKRWPRRGSTSRGNWSARSWGFRGAGFARMRHMEHKVE